MKTGPQGKFISFEGGEGSGKSSLLSSLKKLLQDKKIPFHLSFEPGGTELGSEIREALLKPRPFVSSRSEALLYAAARAQHVEEMIRPKLQDGVHVLCDRFVDASLAYQGVARKLGLKVVRDLNEWAMNGLYPDRTYFLDLDPRVGMKRVQNRSLDRIEQENLAFHDRLREAYQFLAREEAHRYRVINAAQNAADVFRQVSEDLLSFLS